MTATLYEPHNSTTNEPEWAIVCVGCMRIQRDGNWTDEQASDTRGRSTGFCDPCAQARRSELQEIIGLVV